MDPDTENTVDESDIEARTFESQHEEWKKMRKAIVHTVDFSAERSAHAERVVRGFRHGLYAGNVDFHVGDVSEWIQKEIEDRVESQGVGDPTEDIASGAFLSHVILDLPSTHLHIENVTPALQVNGALAVFNPSITQIGACVQMIRKKRLPYILETVVELGAGSTGGRDWDVKAVKPRAVLKAESAVKKTAVDTDGDVSNEKKQELGLPTAEEKTRDEEEVEEVKREDEGWEMICRPKVGIRVVGGGFLGVWRRMREV